MAVHTVRSKIKVKKPQSGSDSDDGSEHELFHYANDRVQLMKEVLKLLKPKKIKSIAPDFMKNLDMEEINSMLLEELLGISNKRLKNILNGVNVDESSSESEDERQPIDVISLDDISDVEDFNSESNEPQKKNKKSKKAAEVKAEKADEKEKLMSVLEILELQARARAIRSQLALENEQKKTEAKKKAVETDDSDVEVITQSSKGEEIVVIDSENENMEQGAFDRTDAVNKETKNEKEPVNIIQNINIERNENLQEKDVEENSGNNCVGSDKNSGKAESIERFKENKSEDDVHIKEKTSEGDKKNSDTNFADDSIVINLDTIEIEEMEK